MIENSGIIWAGSQENGILRVNQDGSVQRLVHDPEDRGSISSNRVWRIFQDRQDRIWVGTESGLNLWLPESQSFHRYYHDVAEPESLSDNLVYDITQDQGDLIWFGTFNGISKWNSEIATFTNLWNIENNSFEHFRSGEGSPDSLSDDMVVSLLLDRRGRLWTGTMRKGLSMMDTQTRKFTNFTFDRGNPWSISSNAVSNMLEDSQGRVPDTPFTESGEGGGGWTGAHADGCIGQIGAPPVRSSARASTA